MTEPNETERTLAYPRSLLRQTPFRRELEGLRAVAIVAIVLSHFTVPGLSGGWVGYDVFMVLAGFFVVNSVLSETRNVGFFLIGSYLIRRIRRLLPEMALVGLATVAAGWIVLLPQEMIYLGQQLLAGALFVANFLFSGHLVAPADSTNAPALLNLWAVSLVVQFYVAAVLFWWVFRRRQVLATWLLVALFCLSLAASVILSPALPEATGYHLPFRLWEFLAGALLAIEGNRRKNDYLGFPPLSWLGIGLILWAIFTLGPTEASPGIVALIPVAGAVLVIANGRNQSAPNIVLRAPIPVYFGKISYGLFLWHWPILVLSSHLRGGYQSGWETLGWLVITFVAAAFSAHVLGWSVRAPRGNRAIALGGAITAAAVLAGLGGWLLRGEGYPTRFGPAVTAHIAASTDMANIDMPERCGAPETGPLRGIEMCRLGPDGPPQFLVWGDDHARALSSGIDLAAQEAARPGLMIARDGCPPLVDIRKSEAHRSTAADVDCTHANLQLRQALRTLASLTDVILVARWTYYANGTGVGLDAGQRVILGPTGGSDLAGESQAALFGRAVQDTVTVLRENGLRVSVFRQPPELPFYDSRRAARELALRNVWVAGPPKIVASVDMAALDRRIRETEPVFETLAAAGAIEWIDPWPAICDNGQCHALVAGEGFFYDTNRLTETASLRLRRLFQPVLPTDARKPVEFDEARLDN